MYDLRIVSHEVCFTTGFGSHFVAKNADGLFIDSTKYCHAL